MTATQPILLELDLWRILGFLLGLTGLYGGLIWGFATVLLHQMNRSLDRRFQDLERVWEERDRGRTTLVDLRLGDAEIADQKLIRDISDLKADLDRQRAAAEESYVHRDEYLAQMASVDQRYERLARRLLEHLRTDHGNAS